MKRYICFVLLLLPFALRSQESSIDTTSSSQWKEVHRLISIKNYAQTLPLLQEIKAAAVKKNNRAEWIRAVLAESVSLRVNQTDDDAFTSTREHFEGYIDRTQGVERAILQNHYAQFLHNNIHRYLSQTEDSFILKKYSEKKQIVDSLFHESLQPKDLLIEQPIQHWTGMLAELRNTTLTPTLFHFLADSYLKFLNGDMPGQDKQRIQLIADLQQFNSNGNYNDATAYLLSYGIEVNYWSSDDNVAKLLNIIDQQKSNYNAYILYKIASIYSHRSPNEALKYLDRALEEYPNSPWINEVKNLSNTLKKTELRIYFDKFAPAKQHTPIKLSIQNPHSEKLYIRVYNSTLRPTNTSRYSTQYDSTSHRVTIDAALAYEEGFPIKNIDDYQSHETIYKLNPLPYGSYTILLSNNADFLDDGLFLDVTEGSIHITDQFISAVRIDRDERNDIYQARLINRNTGLPYSKEKLVLYDLPEKGLPQRVENITTDRSGEFTYQTDYSNNKDYLEDYHLFVPKENQLIALSELNNIVTRHIGDEDADEPETKIIQTLTDRAIYRPGQTVYFKSILYNAHLLNGSVLTNQDVEIFFHDANNQKIDSLALRTNEFGSINGSFQIPANTLTGAFRIVAQHTGRSLNSTTIRVEEYKRPTFKATFDINKETYTSQDTAVFTGTAETLSGVPLTDATVHYKVDFYAPSQRKNISVADTTTYVQDDGKFHIRVPLMDSAFHGLSDYTLRFSAEVVNQTGEMQSASSSYQFSTKPWRIQIQTEHAMEEKRWSKLHILTTNQNGQPLKFAGTVNIYKYDDDVQTPLTEYTKQYFREIEQHTLSQEEYEQYFPKIFDPALLHKERSKTLVATQNFDTRDTSLIQLDSTLFSSGHYHIEAISIQESDTVRTTSEVSIFKTETRKVNDNEFLTYALDKTAYGIGEAVTLTFQTDVPDAKVLYLFEEHGNKPIVNRLLTFKDGKASYKFTLQKEHLLPAIHFSALLVLNNQLQIVSVAVPTHRSDKQLQIKTATFRDKITPGQREKWSFTVQHKDAPFQAEVLATMYDSALDVFTSNSFPQALQLRNSYSRYWPQNYYLEQQFRSATSSQTIFNKHEWFKPQGNDISPAYYYNAVTRTVYYGEGSALLDEVAIVRTESAAKMTMTGSSKVIANVTDLLQGRVAGSNAQSGIRGNTLIRGLSDINTTGPLPLFVVDDEIMEASFDPMSIDAASIAKIEILKDADATALYGSRGANGVIVITTKEGLQKQAQLDAVNARTDLRETAFFYPELYTDAEGNISFEFDSPEALTRWKLLLFAHGKNLEAGAGTFFTQTQKQLMVRPNLPRYLREGDEIVLKAQVQNISDSPQNGNARIVISNPEDNANITALFTSENITQPFSVAAKNNGTVEWRLKVPEGHPIVHIQIVAATEEFSDGEQHELPILPNRVLISDSERIILQPDEHQDFEIAAANKQNLHARVQVQTNPILEILSALDYLKNYPYECTEQTASKWFALQMVRYIQKNYPEIADYFQKLNYENSLGRLEQNTALSELTKEEMPWLRDIQGEERKRLAIAGLFGNNLQRDIADLEKKLIKSQSANGLFPWFEGGKANTHISIRILEITGKVLHLDLPSVSMDTRRSMEKLIDALDQDTTLYGPKAQTQQVLDYLYARHYWNDLHDLDQENLRRLSNSLAQSPEVTARGTAGTAAKAWVVNQVLGDARQSQEIKNRISQEVIHDADKGMYWESNTRQYNAVSLHSYLIEAYKSHDPSKLYEISQWIFYSKEANHWRTTWATVDAIYALLLANNPKDFSLENTISVWVDGQPTATEEIVLGQTSKNFEAKELETDLAISLQNNNSRRVFGSIVHQYFVAHEEVSSAQNGLSVEKQYLVERNGEWVETQTFQLGEKVKVKITLINDNPIEYVHLKDSRPSAFEPIYRPSGYQWWQGYYFSSKDASTNYFFDYLPKGTRTLEYEVKVNNSGVFQSGITTISGMYDPAISARSISQHISVSE